MSSVSLSIFCLASLLLDYVSNDTQVEKGCLTLTATSTLKQVCFYLFFCSWHVAEGPDSYSQRLHQQQDTAGSFTLKTEGKNLYAEVTDPIEVEYFVVVADHIFIFLNKLSGPRLPFGYGWFLIFWLMQMSTWTSTITLAIEKRLVRLILLLWKITVFATCQRSHARSIGPHARLQANLCFKLPEETPGLRVSWGEWFQCNMLAAASIESNVCRFWKGWLYLNARLCLLIPVTFSLCTRKECCEKILVLSLLLLQCDHTLKCHYIMQWLMYHPPPCYWQYEAQVLVMQCSFMFIFVNVHFFLFSDGNTFSLVWS